VSIVHRVWELASKFGKPEKGMRKAETLRGGSDGDGEREVLYKDVSTIFPESGWCDEGVGWVDRIEKDIA
jgi:hypothetical protein